jgi:predicted aspartyl protease
VGTFYVKCKIENPVDRDRSAIVTKALVDTGSEFSWISGRTLEKIGIRREKKDIAFVLANGQQVTRSVGFAIIRLDKFFTIDEVVFAEPSDLQLLGARTLEGLNLSVAPGRRGLVGIGASTSGVADASASNFQIVAKAQTWLTLFSSHDK